MKGCTVLCTINKSANVMLLCSQWREILLCGWGCRAGASPVLGGDTPTAREQNPAMFSLSVQAYPLTGNPTVGSRSQNTCREMGAARHMAAHRSAATARDQTAQCRQCLHGCQGPGPSLVLWLRSAKSRGMRTTRKCLTVHKQVCALYFKEETKEDEPKTVVTFGERTLLQNLGFGIIVSLFFT